MSNRVRLLNLFQKDYPDFDYDRLFPLDGKGIEMDHILLRLPVDYLFNVCLNEVYNLIKGGRRHLCFVAPKPASEMHFLTELF